MGKWFWLRWLVGLGVLLPVLAGCGEIDSHEGGRWNEGNDYPVYHGPGLVGIEDRPSVEITAPQLIVEYVLPGVPEIFVASLLSDQPTDGDIAFDPVLNSFTISQGPDTLFFGIDSADPHRPEYRAFLDFPLDGSTGEPSIPLDATILSATLTVFVDFVDFAAAVPVLLDLVQYPVTSGLSPGDYDSTPLAVRSFDIFSSDEGYDVPIDVTPLMRAAQVRGVADFQVRFLLGP